MDDKEAFVRLSAYMSYDSSKISEQKALDKLEEFLNELDEKHGISINIHERNVQDK